MQFFKNKLHIDFMSAVRWTTIISIITLLIGIGSLAFKGLSFGIDFTGGTLIEVGFSKEVKVEQVRQVLEEGGFAVAQVQEFGSPKDVLVRLAASAEANSTEITNKAKESLSSKIDAAAELRRVEFVGPQVGDELAEDGFLAILVTLMAILLYVALRFEWRFAVGAVACLAHDVVFVVGLFALFDWEFDLTVLAAVLAVIGYSLNDTIVVFDRIRENFRRLRKGTPKEIANISINETMSRTINTSGTTLIVVVMLFLFGGETIHNFSLLMILGIVVGTYSSIYVASAITLALGVSRQDLMPVQKEGAEFDKMP